MPELPTVADAVALFAWRYLTQFYRAFWAPVTLERQRRGWQPAADWGLAVERGARPAAPAEPPAGAQHAAHVP